MLLWGGTIIGPACWVGLDILTKTHLMHAHCGHSWHGLEIGFRICLGLFLCLGYMMDGLESILHCLP